jgi:ribosome-associated protein
MDIPEHNGIRQSISLDDILGELEFLTSRSSGPGGQNVNKVNSKVTVKFDIENSTILSEEHKSILREKLSNRITTNGVLVLSSQDKRSQLDNKEAVLLKLDGILKKAFEKKKRRKKTKPSKAAKENRIKSKKKTSEKKQWRQKL